MQLALFDGRLEAGKIDLAQGAFVHLRIHRVAVQFLTIGSKVLYAGRDLLTLDSLNFRRDQRGDQMRILAKVLEIASAKRRPGNVDAGSQDDVLATLPSLRAKNRSEPMSGLRIPGRGQAIPVGR